MIAIGSVSKHQPRRVSVRFPGEIFRKKPWANAQRLMRIANSSRFETEPGIRYGLS